MSRPRFSLGLTPPEHPRIFAVNVNFHVRFYQAIGQRCEADQLLRRNEMERAEAAAVDRSNQSEAFPSRRR